MRGKDGVKQYTADRVGITPAYAGKSNVKRVIIACVEDHPRLCGEKNYTAFYALLQVGSPPPMRGKVNSVICYVIVSRITPAYAGKSGGVTVSGIAGKDHPRLCGEKNALRSYTS